MLQPAMRDEAMTNQLFEAALGIKAPWYVQGVDFDTAERQLTIAVDFVAGSRFAYPGLAGEHPAHDTQIKRLRHLNFLASFEFRVGGLASQDPMSIRADRETDAYNQNLDAYCRGDDHGQRPEISVGD
jgi:hypothetical protein